MDRSFDVLFSSIGITHDNYLHILLVGEWIGYDRMFVFTYGIEYTRSNRGYANQHLSGHNKIHSFKITSELG